jgi:hypothetical protein
MLGWDPRTCDSHPHTHYEFFASAIGSAAVHEAFVTAAGLSLLSLSTTLALLVLERRRAARVAALVLIGAATVAVAVFAVGELRYHDCITQVDRACPNGTCRGGYTGPFLQDCDARRSI